MYLKKDFVINKIKKFNIANSKVIEILINFTA